ncbi:MAG: DUF4395 domain-containing protein [Paludibacter sp.]|nr:DUF4395 domain-containing protein [Paludibacter sp.]
MKKQFGETVEGYKIPVLNEREIRAAAGILFLTVFIALMQIIFKGNFLPMKYFIVLFFVDFAIRLFIHPKFAPSLILGRIMVTKQNPEYVGAAQKKFAWIIGLVLASTMLLLMVILNTYSAITGIICLICLLFLYFESVFGICFGCIFYGWFYKEKAQYCPGEVCDVKAKQPIQKISWLQVVVLVLFIVFVVGLVLLTRESLAATPVELFSTLNSK